MAQHEDCLVFAQTNNKQHNEHHPDDRHKHCAIESVPEITRALGEMYMYYGINGMYIYRDMIYQH